MPLARYQKGLSEEDLKDRLHDILNTHIDNDTVSGDLPSCGFAVTYTS